jgi:hypothetical protein
MYLRRGSCKNSIVTSDNVRWDIVKNYKESVFITNRMAPQSQYALQYTSTVKTISINHPAHETIFVGYSKHRTYSTAKG